MKPKVFAYKDNLIDLREVATIEFGGNDTIEFTMKREWTYTIEVDEADVDRVKKELTQLFST